MKHLFILPLLFLSLILFAQDSKKPDYSEAIRLIDLWLNGIRDFHKLPGISVAIVDDQQMIWSKAYGFADIDTKTTSEATTIYSICSISKLFTSVAIMQLWEAGKLHLDDSVAAVLPSFDLHQQYAGSGPITIRSLLTHSSGLPRESDFPYWSAPDFNFPTEEEVKEKFKTQQTLYPASTYFQYSNLGLSILGEIVEKISGMRYEDYVEENILKPLRLNDTHPWLPQDQLGKKLATGYSSLYRDGSRKKLSFFQAKGIVAAAGFSSSAEDLARFMSWQFRLLNKNEKEILRPSTLKEMLRVQWMNPDWKLSWGLGFRVWQSNGITYTGHGSSCPGYATQLLTIPSEKLGAAVMINGQGTQPSVYATAILNILKKAKAGKPSNDSLHLGDYAGYYDDFAWQGEVIVVPWQDKLAVLENPTNTPTEDMALLKPVSHDIFRRIRSDETPGEEVRFERDNTGKIIRMWRNSNFINKIK
jgi:CubicO group peptidase (beta-lactamase class C family)